MAIATLPKNHLQFLAAIYVLLVCSCSKNVVSGSYFHQKLPKTRITIHTDGTFEFLRMHPNPYLFPDDHPNERYIISHGKWQAEKGKRLSLTSTNGLPDPAPVTIRASIARDTSVSHFTFYDITGDTIPVLYVQYPDSSISLMPHHSRSFDFVTENLMLKDTLEFHFYGYHPFVFISPTKTNADYRISLYPEFQPDFFRSRQFKWNGRMLIDIEGKARFRRQKS